MRIGNGSNDWALLAKVWILADSHAINIPWWYLTTLSTHESGLQITHTQHYTAQNGRCHNSVLLNWIYCWWIYLWTLVMQDIGIRCVKNRIIVQRLLWKVGQVAGLCTSTALIKQGTDGLSRGIWITPGNMSSVGQQWVEQVLQPVLVLPSHLAYIIQYSPLSWTRAYPNIDDHHILHNATI
jgi:hypothetical protein